MPYIMISIFFLYLIIETVSSGKWWSLVVPSQKNDVLGFDAFKNKEIGYGLDGVIASIDIVTKKYDWTF